MHEIIINILETNYRESLVTIYLYGTAIESHIAQDIDLAIIYSDKHDEEEMRKSAAKVQYECLQQGINADLFIESETRFNGNREMFYQNIKMGKVIYSNGVEIKDDVQIINKEESIIDLYYSVAKTAYKDKKYREFITNAYYTCYHIMTQCLERNRVVWNGECDVKEKYYGRLIQTRPKEEVIKQIYAIDLLYQYQYSPLLQNEYEIKEKNVHVIYRCMENMMNSTKGERK